MSKRVRLPQTGALRVWARLCKGDWENGLYHGRDHPMALQVRTSASRLLFTHLNLLRHCNATCAGDITIPVMSVDPADGELLTRAILRAETANSAGNSGLWTTDQVVDTVVTVDMLEIPPKLK